VLLAISQLTAGRERVNVLETLTDRPRSARMTSLLPWLLSLCVALLLLEIAGRRLALWSKLSEIVMPVRKMAAARVEQLLAGRAPHDRPELSARLVERRDAVKPQASPSEGPLATTTDHAQRPAAPDSTETIFEQAKRRARKRLND
jgi:hypothetical protein